MDSVNSSPTRKKLATYAGKGKRSRGAAKEAKDANSSSDEDATAMPPPAASVKKSMKAKGDLSSLPRTPTPSKAAHSRPSSTKGTPKLPSIQRFQTPEDRDDTASIAESTTSKAPRRTEEERLQWFRDQLDCQEVEPHRAFCVNCKEWVALNPNLTYTMRPWTQHRKACKKGSGQKPSSAATSAAKSPTGDGGESDAEESASAIVSSPEKSVRRNEAQRQVVLEQDPRAEEVRPYEVLCKTCSTWVKLGSRRRYNLEPWKKHQKKCSEQIPSKRVASVQMKVKLTNDEMAKSFTPNSVDCARCNTKVALQGDEYDLSNWMAHKATCPEANTESGSGDGSGKCGPAAETHDEIAVSRQRDGEIQVDQSSGGGPYLANPGTALADGSTVALGPSRGVKRGREDNEDEAEDIDARPAVRRRTSSYPSGALGWLLSPFKSFIDGFKAGLSESQSPGDEAVMT